MRCTMWGLMASLFLSFSPALAGPRNINPGDPIGVLKLTALDGAAVDSSTWSGRPSVWLFISPRQNSSERAMLALQKIVDDTPPPGLAAVLLTTDAEHLPELRDFAARNRIRMPIGLDAGRQQYGRLGIIVMPTLLLVNRDGKLHQSMPGYEPGYEHVLGAHVQFLTGRINEKELAVRISASRPARDMSRERAERLTQSAEVMLGRGLKAEAAAELERAMKTDPHYHKAALDLALLKTATGDSKAADALLDKVLQADPHEREARLVIGIIRFREKRLDDAEKSLKEALMLNPDPARTHYWLARVYEARGDNDAARRGYRAAAERRLPALDAELAK